MSRHAAMHAKLSQVSAWHVAEAPLELRAPRIWLLL